MYDDIDGIHDLLEISKMIAASHFFNLYVGLQGPGWLYVVGMPPRGDVRL